MKLKIAVFLLLATLLIPISTPAQPMGMRSWRRDARCVKASELNLSPEQARGIDLLQQTYLRETQLLRAQLIAKRLEFRELLIDPAIRIESIRMKYMEVVETQSKMEEKAIEYLMKVRNLLTHEQLKFWCPEQEFPVFQRMVPGHSLMGPRKRLTPEE